MGLDLARYLGLFVSDAREHQAGLESALVKLETAPAEERRALLDATFRCLHSLKGASATMGFTPIERLAHAAETLVAALRAGTLELSPEQLDVLIAVADRVKADVDRIEAGDTIGTEYELEARLGRLAEGSVRVRAPATPRPSTVKVPEAPARGAVTVVRITVSVTSAAPAARAFLALRKLEALAPVVQTEPAREAIREGQLPGGVLVATIAGTHALDAITRALARIPDLERVEPVSAAPATNPRQVPATASAAPEAPSPAAQTVRVKVELLDHLLELAGELVLASSRLRERAREVPEAARAPVEEEADRLRQLVRELNTRVLATRQTPVQLLADRLPRAVRDLSRRLGKPLELAVAGADTTLDRGMLDALADPLLHALRNAADHGIESAEERARAGKGPSGIITFAARRERERVVIELSDDGRGFDTARLRDKAVRDGRLGRPEADALGEEQAMRLALLPGLSTRDVSDDVSGRGVGLDAVLRAVEQLGGSVELASRRGKGSTIRMLLPATVSVMNVLLLALGDEIFGLPMSRVRFAMEADLSARGGEGYSSRTLLLGGERVQAHPLGKLLGLPEELGAGPRPYVVVEAEGQRLAVGVDRVLGQEEVVLRPLGPPLERVRGLSGTAILGSGRPIFVLDVPRLVS